MATYSLAVTGILADQVTGTAKVTTLADTQAVAGGQQNAMAQGTAFLCKLADGSQQLCVLDAERSTPANPVIRHLYP